MDPCLSKGMKEKYTELNVTKSAEVQPRLTDIQVRAANN